MELAIKYGAVAQVYLKFWPSEWRIAIHVVYNAQNNFILDFWRLMIDRMLRQRCQNHCSLSFDRIGNTRNVFSHSEFWSFDLIVLHLISTRHWPAFAIRCYILKNAGCGICWLGSFQCIARVGYRLRDWDCLLIVDQMDWSTLWNKKFICHVMCDVYPGSSWFKVNDQSRDHLDSISSEDLEYHTFMDSSLLSCLLLLSCSPSLILVKYSSRMLFLKNLLFISLD